MVEWEAEMSAEVRVERFQYSTKTPGDYCGATGSPESWQRRNQVRLGFSEDN